MNPARKRTLSRLASALLGIKRQIIPNWDRIRLGKNESSHTANHDYSIGSESINTNFKETFSQKGTVSEKCEMVEKSE